MYGYKKDRPCLKIIKKYFIMFIRFYNSQNINKFWQDYDLIQ